MSEQWRIKDFRKGDAEQGVWGMEVPQQGPGRSPGGGLGPKPPQKLETLC